MDANCLVSIYRGASTSIYGDPVPVNNETTLLGTWPAYLSTGNQWSSGSAGGATDNGTGDTPRKVVTARLEIRHGVDIGLADRVVSDRHDGVFIVQTINAPLDVRLTPTRTVDLAVVEP
jgi:hypothetical protein